MRYMDDGRKFMHPVKRGWRWVENSLKYCVKCERESYGRSAIEITKEIIRKTMNKFTSYLTFTVEVGDDFDDGWLPTLDTSLRVNGRNIV